MILLSLRSGKEIAIRGEKWNEVNSAIMGKIHVTDTEGHEVEIRGEAVDMATNIPDAEVKARVEERRRAEAAKEAEASVAAEVAREQAEYMRRHPVRTWFAAMKRRLS